MNVECWQADWVERHIRKNLSDFQRIAVGLICEAQGCGPYDFYRTFDSANWSFGRGVRFVMHPARLSTFDFDGLSKLVIGAHEHCIRVEIEACNMQYIAIIMHPRQRMDDGDKWSWHPTIEEQVEAYREHSSIVDRT